MGPSGRVYVFTAFLGTRDAQWANETNETSWGPWTHGPMRPMRPMRPSHRAESQRAEHTQSLLEHALSHAQHLALPHQARRNGDETGEIRHVRGQSRLHNSAAAALHVEHETHQLLRRELGRWTLMYARTLCQMCRAPALSDAMRSSAATICWMSEFR